MCCVWVKYIELASVELNLAVQEVDLYERHQLQITDEQGTSQHEIPLRSRNKRGKKKKVKHATYA